MKQRARTDQEKARKQELIMSATARMFEKDRCLHSASAIAKEAKVAKGTLYLYFKTKEAIYMELLVNAFSKWHGSLRNLIIDQGLEAQKLPELLGESLMDQTTFIDLFSLAGSVLEENLPPEVVRTQRLRMIQESVRTSQLIAKFWPEEWSEELALRNLRRVYTYAIGYWKDCFPSENVWKAIPENFSNIGSQRELYQEELLYMCRLIWG